MGNMQEKHPMKKKKKEKKKGRERNTQSKKFLRN
jgi:hypothetical protein